MVNKDVQDRSLFLFAPFLSGPHCAAFFKLQLKQQGDDDVKGGGRVTRETPVLKPLLKFFDDPQQSYLCTAARIFSHSKTVQLFGYHDKKNEWHPVIGSTGFIGRAVVVGETLYAVALSHNLVIAFSFGKCGGEDGPIAYTLSPSLALKSSSNRYRHNMTSSKGKQGNREIGQ
ncbi:hypothetical protein FF2_037684 [Malus domestica]